MHFDYAHSHSTYAEELQQKSEQNAQLQRQLEVHEEAKLNVRSEGIKEGGVVLQIKYLFAVLMRVRQHNHPRTESCWRTMVCSWQYNRAVFAIRQLKLYKMLTGLIATRASSLMSLSYGLYIWLSVVACAEQERIQSMVASGLNKQVRKLKEDKLRLKEELQQVLEENTGA